MVKVIRIPIVWKMKLNFMIFISITRPRDINSPLMPMNTTPNPLSFIQTFAELSRFFCLIAK